MSPLKQRISILHLSKLPYPSSRRMLAMLENCSSVKLEALEDRDKVFMLSSSLSSSELWKLDFSNLTSSSPDEVRFTNISRLGPKYFLFDVLILSSTIKLVYFIFSGICKLTFKVDSDLGLNWQILDWKNILMVGEEITGINSRLAGQAMFLSLRSLHCSSMLVACPL